MSDQDNNYLSPDTMHGVIESTSARRRSASMAPSARSSTSAMTVVDYDPNVAAVDDFKETPITETKVIEMTVTWLDCFLGLFRKSMRKHKATFVVELPKDDENKAYITDDSPWILDVCVSSTVGNDGSQSSKHETKCLIDTGNMQGNFVSRDFALKLGYTKSKFRPLKDFERNGGTSSTGHTLVPPGAVHLTWYHNSCPRTFRDMRFLISEDPHFDLVIGARSIQKYNFLSPPNLGQAGTTVMKRGYDTKRTNLNKNRAELKNHLESITQEREKASRDGNKDRVNELDKEIDSFDKKLRVARLEVELYDAKQKLGRDPGNPSQKSIVDTIDKDLREAQAHVKPLKRTTSGLRYYYYS